MDEKGYTPAQLARISGVSVRALHHYDQIGLLVPVRRPNGYRSYTTADVVRLQQILLLRDMGMGLDEIAQIMDDPNYDEAHALRSHLATLRARRTQLDTLIATVAKTLATLEGTQTMTDQERFEGLKHKAIEDNERQFGAEARRRHGDATVEAANERLLALEEREWSDLKQLEEAIKAQLSRAMATGDIASSEAAELVRMHARWVSAHWPEGSFTPEAYRGLADGYLCDERFCAYYDGACGTGATQFLHDAIHAHA